MADIDAPQKTTNNAAPVRVPVRIAATEPVETLRLSQINDRKAIVRQLQGALAIWAPLQAAYEAEMAGRRASRFAVEPIETWVADLVRQMGGDRLKGEDAGAVRDWEERGHQPWLEA